MRVLLIPPWLAGWLAGSQGKIFNLANTVPTELEAQIKAAVTAAVTAAATSVAAEPNRSLAQNL